jgi:hypothetical protein
MFFLYGAFLNNVDQDFLIKKIGEAAISRDKRALDYLRLALTFQVLDRNELIVDRVNHYFPVGVKLSPQEIRTRINLVYTEVGVARQVKSQRIAVMQLNLFKGTKRHPKKAVYEIIGDNPYGIIVTSLIPAYIDKKVYTTSGSHLDLSDF